MVSSSLLRNNEVSQLEGRVTFHYGDRDTHVEFGKLLSYITKKIISATNQADFKWDIVVDFCAYVRKDVKSVIRGLAQRARLYVFISSDSVYDVCDLAVRGESMLEDDDIRVESHKEIMRMKDEEEYGHDKLCCEEYLRNHLSKPEDGFSYICLRMPDVLGPYDSTGRFWAYLLWIQQMRGMPIHTKPEAETKPLSFVFSEDVSRLIVSLLPSTRNELFLRQVHGQAFNVAFDETPSLNQLLQKMVVACNHRAT